MAISINEQKIRVARTAIDALVAEGLIASGTKIGLGTGSTAMPAVQRLGELVQEGALQYIKAVPTSFQTRLACIELHIPVYSLNDREINGFLDICIDGADEISPEHHLIKGGGAALLLEKIVAYNSEMMVIIADESKWVPNLGTRFPLPIEIIPEARTSIIRVLSKMGATCTLREGVRKAGPVVTDNGNWILDCLWEANAKGASPIRANIMEHEINSIVGVVENGFFTKLRPRVYLGQSDGKVKTML